ncbi:hypothetical protein G6F55_011982 [Rhizopus delemar]|uniref:Transposase Tc1-like domain-containing protein n=2 Tax=Rhizopus TaxID=4842 RepID=A0A9P7CIR4_9FUNG|nr:hypothetical protein G6F43_012172 [Rhizopus delemar]KAG1534153.1 hypothetical protein G6F51_012254 [Rhizopus arrhizus]KAG1445375.1 hypothetical protein G6F55_011982 [Rhizopus delemar]KAG1488438.1 hypothetical protein G6F54_012080 [Rhizopus delemar]KAG1496887.1 hypothetical protein G6F53_012084 [Rhizopus delemar]
MQPLTEDRKSTIEFYLCQGFPYHEITKIIKVSSFTVHKIRLELGLSARIDKGGRPKKILINERNRKRRLQWARQHID